MIVSSGALRARTFFASILWYSTFNASPIIGICDGKSEFPPLVYYAGNLIELGLLETFRALSHGAAVSPLFQDIQPGAEDGSLSVQL